MRKFICTVIALVCLLTPCVSAMSFVDVPQSEWYYEDVKGAVESGIINGKTTTEYKPNDNLTYAEAVKLAACMHQLHTTGAVTLQNGSKDWYSTYVEYCKNNKIISKDYDYNAKATRAGYMVIFANALPDEALKSINNVVDNSIPDVSMSSDYASSVYKLYRAGILQGVDEKHNCNPDSNIKRSEVAAIITRMMNEDKRVKFSIVTKASDAEASDTDWENTGGAVVEGEEHATGNAGSLPEIPGTTRYVFNKDLSLSQNINKLNGYLFDVYGFRMFGDGLSLNEADEGACVKFVYKDGRFGIQVFEWRHSYDSDYGTNGYLNGAMECMYALCGDRDVAYALWSWVDAKNINGRANSDDFGFTDVVWSNGSGIITMNGINIEVDNSTPGVSVYYFD